MEFEEYLLEQDNDLNILQELDLVCKKKKQFIGRYVSVGFTDRTALYVVVEETPKKYLLRFAWGESQYPDWGDEIRLYKKNVEDMIFGRDFIETVFPKKI